jgi:hypothetical protein
MRTQIEAFINSQVTKTSKGNVFTFNKPYFEFVIVETYGRDLPMESVCWIEGSLESGDDEINVKYTLISFDQGLATYKFEVV